MAIFLAGARQNYEGGFLVPGLALGAWLFLVFHVVALDAPGIVTRTGPGMELVAVAISVLSGDGGWILPDSSLCLTPTGPWGLGDFAKAFSMWSAMTVAMMLPAAFRAPVAMATVVGYLIAWIPVCIVGVLLQWSLQQAGFLDGFLVSVSPALNLAVLVLAAASVCRRRSAVRRAAASVRPDAGIRGGLDLGFTTIRGCGMVMALMFVVGLMNLVAMAILTAAMFFLTRREAGQG